MSLTDEDKQWIGQQFEQMDRRLERVETTLLAEARRRAVAASLCAIELERQSLSDLATKLKGRPQ
jgi:hypothetical protein